MTKKEYETFFKLLAKITHDKQGSWEEKLDSLLEGAADANDAMNDLRELASWIE